MLKGLIRGDNIVWQVDRPDDYRPFVEPYARAASKVGEPLVYFRFGDHSPLVPDDVDVRVCELNPKTGFEGFVTSIHHVIEEVGRGGYYVFDCLSCLAEEWCSDQMLGNFFMLTCPHLFDVEAIAYFGLLRSVHSVHATRAITDTTQVFLDVYHHQDDLYVHPWKVQSRHSQSMHMLHKWGEEDFLPVSDSVTISEVRYTVPWLQSDTTQGIWTRAFALAEELEMSGAQDHELLDQRDQCIERLIRMCVTREDRLYELVKRHFTLDDLIAIGKRVIGTGLIGGKSVGMLLAQLILRQANPKWADILESHDSFYVGSDVFYTYIVLNGIWSFRERVRDHQRYLEGAEKARQRMLIGSFPDRINKQFEDMLDYFGQSPIIVRSSSLLEDNFGNAFAGKYESVFCANQGSRHQRLEDFLAAVRTIYASTMSEKALTYRAQRGLLDQDEQMALLVQRVSGQMYQDLYFPQAAGVGFSYNPYAWSDDIDPNAGLARLVFGMGTRAVDRSDDDYTRVVALNAPHRRPEESFQKVRQYSQRKVDVLDLNANQLVSVPFRDIVPYAKKFPLNLFASTDEGMLRRTNGEVPEGSCPYVLTFEGLFEETQFVQDMREMLSTLHHAYDYPVDVEFAANFYDKNYRINLVQCRPLQVKGGGTEVQAPVDLDPSDVVLDAREVVIGRGQNSPIDRVIYVVPKVYGQLPIVDRHAVARMVGRVCHLDDLRHKTILLVGPGRWGTTSPSLGVPVRFSEIDRVSAVCEYVAMNDQVTPDVSLGTHFFSDLIESEILYFALFPDRPKNMLNTDVFEASPNRLVELVPDAGNMADVVRVIDGEEMRPGRQLILYASPTRQRAMCFLSTRGQIDQTGPEGDGQ